MKCRVSVSFKVDFKETWVLGCLIYQWGLGRLGNQERLRWYQNHQKSHFNPPYCLCYGKLVILSILWYRMKPITSGARSFVFLAYSFFALFSFLYAIETFISLLSMLSFFFERDLCYGFHFMIPFVYHVTVQFDYISPVFTTEHQHQELFKPQ